MENRTNTETREHGEDSQASTLHEEDESDSGADRSQNVEPQVLQPDNPLMLRFQIALKAHLTNQTKKLEEDILGLELTLKEESKNYMANIEIRDLEQQAVCRQNIVIDKERTATEKVISDREKLEEKLKKETELFKETSDLFTKTTNKEKELRLEKESLAALVKQFTEWEESQKSEITIAQRISEKNKTEKNVYTKDKIYQDLLLVKLTSEVLNLSTKFAELEKNIKQKQSEAETVLQSVADGNADLEALERENKRLMQVWNQVILQIQQRDRVMVDANEELLKAQENYTRLNAQVESFKKSSAEEVKKNETLTQTKKRMEGDLERLELVHSTEEDKQRKLRENLVQFANISYLSQRDLNNIIADSKEKEVKCEAVQKEIDKLLKLKYELEEQVFAKLHEQVVLSKAEKQSAKMITNLRNSTRKLETQMANAQNELARVLLAIEQENKYIKEQSLVIDEEKRADAERDKELKCMEAGLKQLETTISRKQGQVDSMNTRLADINSKTQGVNLSPEELQIAALEKALAETVNNIEELHASWMREQSRIVTLTQQRNTLLNKLNIFRKQILVIKQKHLKTESEIERLKKEEANMKRNINSLEKQLTSLNIQCSKRKGYKESLDNENLASQNQLICELKDAEVKALTMQEQMCYIEIDKEELRKDILQAQRDFLAWEKKLIMATETKQSIEKAKAEGGELANMKAEIHRMEVRYAQLQKVQEKLAHDMEMSISRRDGIVERAQAREKRSTKRALYTRLQFKKKLDDLRTKIKQTKTESKAVEKAFNSSEKHMFSLTDRERTKKNQLSELKDAVSQMQAHIAEGQLHRQRNLEMLVRKQRKAKQYADLKAGRYKLSHRQESALDLEIQKQKTVNADLISIVESLNTDFPVLEHPLALILNTLKSPAA